MTADKTQLIEQLSQGLNASNLGLRICDNICTHTHTHRRRATVENEKVWLLVHSYAIELLTLAFIIGDIVIVHSHFRHCDLCVADKQTIRKIQKQNIRSQISEKCDKFKSIEGKIVQFSDYTMTGSSVAILDAGAQYGKVSCWIFAFHSFDGIFFLFIFTYFCENILNLRQLTFIWCIH